MDSDQSPLSHLPRIAFDDAPDRLKDACKFCELAFARSGEVPLAYLVRDGKEATFFDVGFMPPDIAASFGRKIGEMFGEVVYVAEAWEVHIDYDRASQEDIELVERLRRERRFKDHPDARESVTVVYATKERTLFAKCSIIRSKDKTSRLTPWRVVRKTDDLTGRFMEFFNRETE